MWSPISPFSAPAVRWILLFCFIIGSKCADLSRYDNSFTLFSDKGELKQVQYARVAGMMGQTAACALTSDSQEAIFCTKLTQQKHVLLDSRHLDKIMKVDDGVYVCFSGLAGDGRALVNSCREFCLEYHSKLGCRPSVLGVATMIANLQHKATLGRGKRPLGVQVMIVGASEDSAELEIYKTEPSGNIVKCIGTAIGQDSDVILDHWDDEVSEQDPPEPQTASSITRLFTRLLSKKQSVRSQLAQNSEKVKQADDDHDVLQFYRLRRDSDQRWSCEEMPVMNMD